MINKCRERDRDAGQTAADPARHRERDRSTGQTAADPKRKSAGRLSRSASSEV